MKQFQDLTENILGTVRYYRRHPMSFLWRFLVILATLTTVLVIVFTIGYIILKGIVHITPSLFALEYTSENASLMPALINTLIITVFSLLIAIPLGIFSAIYLVEYAKRGNRFVAIVRMTAQTLSGIPSIVYGLFGMLFFVTALGWGYCVLSGVCTLSIMILPIVMRTTEEALQAVPDSFREGSFGLGAGRLRTVVRVVLPSAIPGILSGVILSIGRIVGETAALMYTAGTVADVADNLFASGRTLSLHMYLLSKEALHTDQAYATAVVLLALVALINALSSMAAKRLQRSQNGG